VLPNVVPLNAARDELTGLAGRSLFLRTLDEAVTADAGVSLLFVDLDNFKAVNDAYGHAVGDGVLSAAAERISAVVRDGDVVARLGGDEFAVLCHGVSDEARARALGERVRLHLAAPLRVCGRELRLSASIGCRVVAAGGAPSLDGLLGDADAAMYQAKESGRDRVELFSRETQARQVRRLELADALRRALGTDQLQLHYQPHVDLASRAIVGAEALARWTHPELGAVRPDEFIAIAEQFGLIIPLGGWVLEQAVATLARWQAAGHQHMLSVNVSAAQLADAAFADLVDDLVTCAGVSPARLCLELTESTLMSSSGHGIEALSRLRDRGHYVAIDDFGTGYSSLAYLKRLPVEVIKIDRQFVDGVAGDPEDAAIVASITSLAHAMGLHIVAEGVETEPQAHELRALGCAVAQGYLFSPALPVDEFDALYAAGLPPAPRRVPQRCPRREIVDEMMHQIGIPEEAL